MINLRVFVIRYGNVYLPIWEVEEDTTALHTTEFWKDSVPSSTFFSLMFSSMIFSFLSEMKLLHPLLQKLMRWISFWRTGLLLLLPSRPYASIRPSENLNFSSYFQLPVA